MGETGDDPAFSILRTIPAGTWATIAAINEPDGAVKLQVIEEDFALFDTSQARVTIFHAIPDAPPVNVQVAQGAVLVQRLGFPGSLGDNDGVTTLDVPAGTYDLWVTPSTGGTVLLDLPGTALEAGSSYFVAAIGSLETRSVALAATPLGQ